MSEDLEILKTNALSVWYGKKRALHPTTLSFKKGVTTALVGPSGCGKSSYLHCLNRLNALIPGCRVEGSVEFKGQNLAEASKYDLEIFRKIGLIFQQPNPFPLSIRRNLELPLVEAGYAKSDIADLIEQACEKTGLWKEVKDRLEHNAHSLSGGQMQRLCIARAIALKPEILLLDEPCSALDPVSSGKIEELITELARNTTTVIVTHNIGQARRISQRAAVFWWEDGAGKVLEEGNTMELFAAPAHKVTRDYLAGSLG